jgi:hypothetical protein
LQYVEVDIKERSFSSSNLLDNLRSFSQLRKGVKLGVELQPLANAHPKSRILQFGCGKLSCEVFNSPFCWRRPKQITKFFKKLEPVFLALRLCRDAGICLDVRIGVDEYTRNSQDYNDTLYELNSSLDFSLDSWEQLIFAKRAVSNILRQSVMHH